MEGCSHSLLKMLVLSAPKLMYVNFGKMMFLKGHCRRVCSKTIILGDGYSGRDFGRVKAGPDLYSFAWLGYFIILHDLVYILFGKRVNVEFAQYEHGDSIIFITYEFITTCFFLRIIFIVVLFYFGMLFQSAYI